MTFDPKAHCLNCKLGCWTILLLPVAFVIAWLIDRPIPAKVGKDYNRETWCGVGKWMVRP